MALAQGDGTKKTYFENIRRLAHTTLTMVKYETSGIRLAAAEPNQFALFIGDSEIRELTKAFKGVINVPAVYEQHHEGAGGYNPIDSNFILTAHREVLFRAEQQMNGKNASVIFVGGYSTHHLLFKAPPVPCLRSGPIKGHQELMEKVLPAFAKWSAELGIPIVFVGSMPMDADTFHLEPRGQNWRKFVDLSLPHSWEGVEASVFHSIQKSNGGHLAHREFPLFYHYRQSSVGNECPGVRCDGYHYGSYCHDGMTFDTQSLVKEGFDWGECTPSDGLLQRPLAQFLLEHFSGSAHP